MDLDEAITITPLDIKGTRYYMLIGWLAQSFELYLYSEDKLWIGKFSSNRLAGFSKNLHLSQNAYYARVKQCLTEQKENYCYELQSGFFYWKRKQNECFVIEGFMPIELDTSPKKTRPDLVEVMLAINKQLKYKVAEVRSKYTAVKAEYEKCLKDTEEFLNLKIDMEKALCQKFLNTLHIKKSAVRGLEFKDIEKRKSDSKVEIKVVSRTPVSDATSILSMMNVLASESKFYDDDEILKIDSDASVMQTLQQ